MLRPLEVKEMARALNLDSIVVDCDQLLIQTNISAKDRSAYTTLLTHQEGSTVAFKVFFLKSHYFTIDVKLVNYSNLQQ